MQVLLALCAVIIFVLMAIVLLLSFKLFHYRRVCARYEILEKSQLINNWHKSVAQQTRIPIDREANGQKDIQSDFS